MVPRRRTPSAEARWTLAVLAAVSYVPLLVTHPGQVAADTRQTVLVDPARFLSRAWSLWDDASHLGTVTHQNVGLLFPYGTWFWLTERLGLPVWLSQRLWLGSILFLAGAGMLYLLRGRGWQGAGVLVASVAYALTPYVLQYANRTSVLALPFAGLPWLLACTDRALRGGGWRHPAGAALVGLVVGGGNATALVFMGLGAVVWVVVATLVREVPWRRALAASARIGVLVVATSAWWVAVLAVQARYGLDVLAYTESLGSVSTTSASHEVLRGLGYWIFYGQESNQPNVAAAPIHLLNPAILVLGFAIAGLGLLAATVTRYRERAFVLVALLTGVVVATATYPFDDASPLGRAIIDQGESRLGLALRSSNRVTPLVVLALALALGAGTSALSARWRALGRPGWAVALPAGLVVLLVAGQPALFTGDRVDRNYRRSEDLPSWWTEAATVLDGRGEGTRVLEVPGQPFTSYRWGTTYEPVTPGLLDRPTVAREQLPYGSPPSADLLAAFDRRLQEGVFEPESVAPVARLLAAGDVLLRSDLRYERYLTARPRPVWSTLRPVPDGLAEPEVFGEAAPNEPEPWRPLLDEQDLASLGPVEDPPPVAVFGVEDAPGIVRVRPDAGALLVAGDGEGIVDLAAAGVVTGQELLRSTAAMTDEAIGAAVGDGATVVVTDSNRRRTRRWRGTRGNVGATLRADQDVALDAQGDVPLEVFPDQTSDDQTVAVQTGGTVDASAYGGPFLVLDPDARPASAFDGDPTTDWAVGPGISGVGEWIEVTAADPVTAGTVTLLQRQVEPRYTRITSVRLTADGARTADVALDASSLLEPGQPVPVPGGTFSTLRITITAIAAEPGFETFAPSQHGFAEITADGLQVDEVLRLPVRPMSSLDPATPLVVAMARGRSDPADTSRRDEETALARSLRLPAARELTLEGTARLSSRAAPAVIDALVDPGADVVATDASGVLPGSLASRPAAIVDGDVDTAWQPPFDASLGAWVELELDAPVTLDSLDLSLVTDGRHSVPSVVTVAVDDSTQQVLLPPLPVSSASGRTEVTVPLTPASGRRVTLFVDELTPLTTPEYFAGGPRLLPVGIAEWRLPGVAAQSPPSFVDTGCRDDLLTAAGAAVPVRITGSVEHALRGGGLEVDGCGAIALPAGDVEVRAVPGRVSGIDLDRLVLRSTTAAPDGSPGVPSDLPSDVPSDVKVDRRSPTSLEVRVRGVEEPSWLVLGESFNEGWRLSVDGRDVGAPQLVDGYANGWPIDASAGEQVLRLTWAPQRWVTWGLAISAIGALVCLALLVRPRPRTEPLPAWTPVIDLGGARRSPPGVVAAWTVAWGLAGAALVHPAAGVALGAAALVSRLRPRLVPVGRLAGLGLVAASFVWVALGQVRSPRPADYGWTLAVRGAHWLALAGLLLVLAVEPFGARTAPPGEARARWQPARRVRAWWGPPLDTGDRVARRRWRGAGLAGGLLGLVLQWWMLSDGRWGLLRWDRVSDFYDAQARAWLAGRWDIDPKILGIEAFFHEGKAFMYQGPLPAVLRLPFVAISDTIDGRFTPVSMLIALVLALVFLLRLGWRLRHLVLGDAPVTRGEQVATAVLVFVAVGGSSLLYASSRTWVYHEAIAWGVALTLGSFDHLIAWLRHGRTRSLVLATTFATLSFLTRASVGGGAVAALALAAGAVVAAWLAGRLRGRLPRVARFVGRFAWLPGADADTPPRTLVRRAAVLAGCVAVPVVLYAAVNYVKFGTLFSVPFDQQQFTLVDANRQEMLALNGSLFNWKFVPTNLLQYWRPDMLGFSTTWPFINFPQRPIPVIGDLRYDLLDKTAGVPATMPVLVALALVGLVAIVRGGADRRYVPLRIPLVATVLGTVTVLNIGYIANRYQSDFLPLLLVPGLVGAPLVLSWVRGRRPAVRRGLVAVLAGAAAFTVLANLALGYVFQRAYGPVTPPAYLAGYVERQLEVDDALGDGRLGAVTTGEQLPASGRFGDLFILGDCDGLYWADGMVTNAVKLTNWNGVERTAATGALDLTVTFRRQPPGTREPLVATRGPNGTGLVFVEHLPGDRIAIGYEGPGLTFTGTPLDVEYDTPLHVHGWLDPNVIEADVFVGERLALVTYYDGGTDLSLGVNPERAAGATAAFSGTIEARPVSADLCERLQPSAVPAQGLSS